MVDDHNSEKTKEYWKNTHAEGKLQEEWLETERHWGLFDGRF